MNYECEMLCYVLASGTHTLTYSANTGLEYFTRCKKYLIRNVHWDKLTNAQ